MLRLTIRPLDCRTLLAAAIGALCLLPFQAQAQLIHKPAATIVEMAGQVSILEGPGQLKALFLNNPVYAQQKIVTGADGYARFLLEDHSSFEVFPNSQVTFKEDWPGIGNLLNVWLGKVKVYIDHSKGPNHNSVSTPTAIISVRGTIFDVDVEDVDGTTLISVDTGWVHVRTTTAFGLEKDLYDGDAVRIYRNLPLGKAGGGINRGILQKAVQSLDDALRQVLLGRTGGVGPIGSPGGAGSTGAQGDKGKTTGTPTGAPAPPPPPPPGGGGN